MAGRIFRLFTNPAVADKFATRLLGAPVLLSRASDEATERAAVWLAGKVRTGIRSQSPGGKRFEPLKQSTIDRKGSTKALIDKSDLVRSIQAHRISTATFVVGVHRSARNRTGQKLVLIGKVHEEGFPSGASRAQEGATRQPGDRVNIPARPYLEPTFRKHEDQIVKMVGDRIGKTYFKGL